jgi:hypothetical protein
MICLPRPKSKLCGPTSHISIRWRLGEIDASAFRGVIERDGCKPPSAERLTAMAACCDRYDAIVVYHDERREAWLRSELEKIGATLVVQ